MDKKFVTVQLSDGTEITGDEAMWITLSRLMDKYLDQAEAEWTNPQALKELEDQANGLRSFVTEAFGLRHSEHVKAPLSEPSAEKERKKKAEARGKALTYSMGDALAAAMKG